MGKKLYIGNLPFSVTEQELSNVFSKFGTVESMKVITDPMNGRSKGFAFAEMSSDSEAQDAINQLDGTDYEGRNLKVNEARPMVRRDNKRNFDRGRDSRKFGNRW